MDEIKCLKYSESSRETLLIYWQEYYHYLEFIITVGLIIQYYFAKKYKIHFKSFAFFFFFCWEGFPLEKNYSKKEPSKFKQDIHI